MWKLFNTYKLLNLKKKNSCICKNKNSKTKDIAGNECFYGQIFDNPEQIGNIIYFFQTQIYYKIVLLKFNSIFLY